MRKHAILLLVLALLPGCAALSGKGRVLSPSPAVLPGTVADHKSPAYWIARYPEPDRIIMSPAEIVAFNGVRENPPDISCRELENNLREALQSLRGRSLFTRSGAAIGGDFFARVERNIDMSSLSSRYVPRYGFVTGRPGVDVRVLPSAEGLYALAGDLEFDELQNSSYDWGAKVIVYALTRDGQWCYAATPDCAGWVPAETIAFCSKAEYDGWLSGGPFVVVTAAKADIFSSPGRTGYVCYARMGTAFPLARRDGENAVIRFPMRRAADGAVTWSDAYVALDQLHEGFLGYTPRVLLEQAFKLLNAPYGWGGSNGEQDCSSFIQEVFACAGIKLPRNSSEQARIGCSLGDFSAAQTGRKRTVLREQAVPGITLLYLKGHIMLYVGEDGQQPYAIHAFWAYREHSAGREIVRVVNRVAVTGLSLGAGTTKGSLLERLKSIRLVR